MNENLNVAYYDTDLPKGWVWSEIREIGEIVTGTTPSKSREEYYGSDYPFFKPADINSGYYVRESHDGLSIKGIEKARLLPERSTLVTCIGATIGKTGLIRKAGASNQQINAVIPSELISPEFVYFVCISPQFQKSITDNASATTLPILNKGKFEILPIPLPPSAEQHRIVDKIEELFTKLDAGIEYLKKAQVQLRQYRQSVLKAAVGGKLTEEWREAHRDELEPASVLLERILKERREKWEAEQLEMLDVQGKVLKDGKWKGKYKEPSSPDTQGLHDLPMYWHWATLDSIAIIKGGITKNKARKVENGRMIPYLRVANVQRGYLDLTEIKEIEATEEVISELLLQKGDILFTEGGDRDKLGRGWIWRGEIQECIHQNHVFRARLCSPDISSKLVSWFSNSFGQEYFMREGKQTTNLASINLTKLRSFPVPIPPALEQEAVVNEIERHLSVAEEAESTIDSELKRAERLRQSILKQAFSGQLVPQDPSDEPASVLLERIKAEKAAREAEKKRARESKAKQSKEPKQMELL